MASTDNLRAAGFDIFKVTDVEALRMERDDLRLKLAYERRALGNVLKQLARARSYNNSLEHCMHCGSTDLHSASIGGQSATSCEECEAVWRNSPFTPNAKQAP